MRIKTKLKILSLVTLIGLGLISIFTISGLHAMGEAEQTAHRRESYVVDLVEIKASALSTIMLDPNLQESKDVFAAAEQNIALHGDAALKVIKRAEIRDKLKIILNQWRNYDQRSQEIIKLAASDPKSANEKLVPLYNHELKPFQSALDKFVSDRKDEAVQASNQAKAVANKTYWEVIVLLVLVTVITIAVVLNLSMSLQAGLRGIQQKLIPLKQGDLTQRLPSDTSDELSEISTGVNDFIQELQSIVQRTRERSNRVASSAVQLASASAQVMASSNHQSEATSSVAAAVEQFSVSIDQVSDNAAEAEKKATLSGDFSRRGGSEVQTAVDEIRLIEQVVSDASNQIESLGRQAQEISSIVNVIKEVADQTNLLALNAAIEAARAGEQGRGFAVVADEVRKLAERTTQSALEITSMVASIQGETVAATSVMLKGNELVAQGVRKAEQAGASMLQINDSSSGVINAVSDISSALREQRVASSEIARNVERIAQMTEESSAAVSEVSSAAKQLENLAEELQQEVAKFKT